MLEQFEAQLLAVSVKIRAKLRMNVSWSCTKSQKTNLCVIIGFSKIQKLYTHTLMLASGKIKRLLLFSHFWKVLMTAFTESNFKKKKKTSLSGRCS